MPRVRKESDTLVDLVAVTAQLGSVLRVFSDRRNADLQLPDHNLALAVVVLVLPCIPRQLPGQTFTFTTFAAPVGAARR